MQGRLWQHRDARAKASEFPMGRRKKKVIRKYNSLICCKDAYGSTGMHERRRVNLLNSSVFFRTQQATSLLLSLRSTKSFRLLIEKLLTKYLTKYSFTKHKNYIHYTVAEIFRWLFFVFFKQCAIFASLCTWCGCAFYLLTKIDFEYGTKNLRCFVRYPHGVI